MVSVDSLKVEEKIKTFLVIGETIEEIHSYTQLNISKIITAMAFFLVGVLLTGFSLEVKGVIIFMSAMFLLFSIYQGIKSFQYITVAVTKFRIIIIEKDLFSKVLFSSSTLAGFTDLHFEHIESIKVSTNTVNVPKFIMSILGISIGWFFISDGSSDFLSLISIFLMVVGVINLMTGIPFGGTKLVLLSISGEILELSEKKTPEPLMTSLILNCRTYLSYGAN